MGFIGFVIAGGGSIGVFLGGVLTDALDWHRVFLVNIPIGAAVIVLCFVLAALYLQLVLDYSPLEVGLAFLPANMIMAAFSLGLSERIVL
jgi:hypothetical protein